jgi:dienelactone hydrolase
MKRFTGRRMYLVGLAAAALALVVLAPRFAPTAALSLGLALPATEASFALLFPDAVREEIVLSAGSRTLQADLYRPVTPRAALLLVHGLSRAGRRHAELVRLARLLARHGQLVLVPQLEGLVAFRLDGTEIDEIRDALGYLGRLSPVVGIAGFSFGAGPALLAAAAYPEIALVGSFGGYADLQNVIAYVTTGVHTFDGRHYVQQQEEYNRWKLLALLVGFVESERDRALLGAIARRTLENPGVDTTTLAPQLGRDGHAVLSLVLNRQASAVAARLADLSPRTRQALASLSPLAAVPRLGGRLLIAHGMADDSIPFTESLRLAEAAGGRAELALLDTFHHTGAQPFWWSWRARVADGWNLARLADALVRIDRHRR